MSNFQRDLEYEKRSRDTFDDFYIKNFKVNKEDIKVYDYDDPDGRYAQKHDIDVSIISPQSKQTIYISEKTRQHEWYDFEFELWSDFTRKKPGYSNHHFEQTDGYFGPDILIKNTPLYFWNVWIDDKYRKVLSDIYNELTWDELNKFIGHIHFNKNEASTFHFKIDVLGIKDCTLLVTNNVEKTTYISVCICIPWHVLIKKYGLTVYRYKLLPNNTYFKKKLT